MIHPDLAGALRRLLDDIEVVAALEAVMQEEQAAWEAALVAESQRVPPNPLLMTQFGAHAATWGDIMGLLYRHAELKQPQKELTYG